MTYEIDIEQTLKFNHKIVVECEEEDIEDIFDRLSRVEQSAYTDFRDFVPEIKGCGGVSVIDTIEDGSGECEWDFDYTED